MTWHRTTYPINAIENGIASIQHVRGLSNGLFGIRYEAGAWGGDKRGLSLRREWGGESGLHCFLRCGYIPVPTG